MATRTSPPNYPASQQPISGAEPAALPRTIARQIAKRESVAVALILALAAALRLVLAARGWNRVNSDEATLGLMVDDILWHGAHPVFLYGQHYLGSLQAYLAVPFFVALGPNNFALHTTTTFQTLLFLLVLYAFTRRVYSPGVAWCALVLMALGPEQALFYELRAAVHTQDVLLFGALLLWLVVLRLDRAWSPRAKYLLSLSIGLVMGLGLWGTFLIVPFILAAGLALGVEALRRGRQAERVWKRGVLDQALALSAGASIGVTPLIAGTIASRGVLVGEILQASGTKLINGSAPVLGVPGHMIALGQQAAATFLVGLPHIFGSTEVCANCPIWPAAQSTASPAEALRAALISAPFSLLALALWLVAARLLACDAWRAFKAARRGTAQHGAWKEVSPAAISWGDARWWGRAMLVTVAALTVLEYMSTRLAYASPDTAARYLAGLYLCTPLLADPLWRGGQQVWHRLCNQKHRASISSAHVHTGAFLATGLLICLLLLNSAGAALALRTSANRLSYGVPDSGRDMQLLHFLQVHHITHFYTSYWVCDRLMFAAQEQIVCGVLNNADAFHQGTNRVPADYKTVAASPHPAYVFDLTSNEVEPNVPSQVARRMAAGDPHFAGYTSIQVARYLIYYYAGP